MASKTITIEQVLKAVESIRADITRLEQRITALESSLSKAPVAAASPNQAAGAERLSGELILVISAAIAAFLGVKPHIRQIRLVGSVPWPQQGRVTIQGSHRLNHG